MKRLLQNVIAAGLGLFSALYLLNPGAGGVEFIADIFPIVGNLDEATAVLVLLRCLAHFGIDLTFLTRLGRQEKKPDGPAPARPAATKPRETVIDV